jgi:Uma2 family endonuclease
MALPKPEFKFDLESYLAWEDEQIEKHEYHQGEIFAMVGARLPHQTLSGNVYAALKSGLRGTPCRTYLDGTKLRIEADDAVLYPDVMVTCDPRDKSGEDRYLSWPILIVEVLSESTAAYDLGPKFALYRKLETLREYLIIDPDSRRIEVFRRNEANLWVLRDFTGESIIELTSIGVTLPAEVVFEDFDQAASSVSA